MAAVPAALATSRFYGVLTAEPGVGRSGDYLTSSISFSFQVLSNQGSSGP